MRGILNFASLGSGLLLTLLLGAEAGISFGLLIYLAGSSFLIQRELERIDARLDTLLRLLAEPLQGRDVPSSPSAKGDAPGGETQSTHAQHLQSLGQKLDALQHQAEAPPPPGAAPHAARVET